MDTSLDAHGHLARRSSGRIGFTVRHHTAPSLHTNLVFARSITFESIQAKLLKEIGTSANPFVPLLLHGGNERERKKKLKIILESCIIITSKLSFPDTPYIYIHPGLRTDWVGCNPDWSSEMRERLVTFFLVMRDCTL